MANWKKVIVSGSAAELSDLSVDNLASGSVVIGGGAGGNLTTTAINGSGNILATEGATGVSMTGSFSGSFTGDGSGLTDIPASAITGLVLNSNAIATGSVSASVDIGTNSFTIVSGSTTLFNVRNNGGLEHGNSVTASGNWSHAEGYKSIASGSYSHAEGNTTQATGLYSHAEGSGTTASGYGSHAEGTSTQAVGDFSHAEGNTTLTGGTNGYLAISVVAGLVTLSGSYGDVSTEYGAGDYLYLNDLDYDYSYSVVVLKIDSATFNGTETEILLVDTGVSTTTAVVGNLNQGITNWTGDQTYRGNHSHAEGYQTSAIGLSAHAEGGVTTASGNYSHAEGYTTTASGNGSHAEGQSTTASGYYSHAEGYTTTASGNASHAEGNSTTASGAGSHAEGQSTTASGYYSHAEGYQTIALGSYSHAEGNTTTASGNYSHAEGGGTTASGTYSHAEGNGTVASGVGAHAKGRSTTASGTYSHAEGNTTIASGSYSHAEGNQTIALGDYSHAEGYSTTAQGDYSHAEGSTTTASGNYSHAEGGVTTASGNYSHAEGYTTTASGNGSHAEGQSTTASGLYSHAEGTSTTASGYSSHAEGIGTIASGSGQLAAGTYNTHNNATSLVVIGNGADDNNRSDLALFNVGSITFNAPITGSIFSGSFVGDGSQLTGVVATDLAFALTGSTGIDYFVFDGSAAVNVAVSGASTLNSNTVTKWTGDAFADTNITDDGTVVTIDSNTTVSGSLNVSGSQVILNTSDFQINSLTLGWPLLTADESNGIILNDIANGNISVHADYRTLSDSGSATSVDWNNRQLIKSDGTTVAFDWENGQMTGSLTVSGSDINLTTNILNVSIDNGLSSIIYAESGSGFELFDLNGARSIFVDARQLNNSNGDVVVDWENGLFSGSFSGSFQGDGSGLTGLATTLSGSTDSGNFEVNLLNQYLTVQGTANEIEVSGSGQTITIGLPSDVTISNNLTVTGDLIVNGTTTVINTTNTAIEDQFILLASGSTSTVDAGIIVQNAANAGEAFYWENNPGSVGRWAIASNIAPTATTVTAAEYMVTAITTAGAPASAPTYGGSTTGYGNIHVNSVNGDIYIYA